MPGPDPLEDSAALPVERSATSLASRLLLLAAAIAVPLLCLASGIVWLAYTEAKARAEDALLVQARVLAVAVDREFELAKAVAGSLAVSTALADGDLPAFEREMRAISAQYGGAAITLVNREGEIILLTAWPPGPRPRPVRATGAVQEVLRTGQPQVSNLFLGVASGKPTVAVAVPVLGEPALAPPGVAAPGLAAPGLAASGLAASGAGGTRQVTGAIGFALPPSSLAGVIAEQSIPDRHGWTGSISDRGGTIVARSRDNGSLTGQPMRQDMRQLVESGPEGVLLASTTREGVPAMVAFRHSPISGFIAVRTMPESEFQGPLRAALFRIIGFGTLVTALALGLALLVARRTVAAFQSLTLLVEGGGPPGRTGLRDADELAAAFALALEERSRSERHRRLVVAELNHRVKNVLATVQAVAAQTLRGHPGGDAAQIGADLDGRLRALARAHDMLTAISWEDAALKDVVQAALAPWRGDDTAAARIDLSGLAALAPSLPLSPAQAQTLALALHELATNALKYGALSTPQGRVTLDCRTGPEGEVALAWIESGGPPVPGPPTRRGFGMRLLERALARDLGTGAGVELRFEPGGVRATIRFSPTRPSAI